MATDRITLAEINVSSGRLYLETHLKNEGKEGFRLTIFDGENVWEGILTEDDLDQQCDNIKMDFNTYITETKAAFTQENAADHNFEYHFKPTANQAQFSWKKLPTPEVKYHLGSVNLKKCSKWTSKICDLLSHSIAQVQALQAQVKSLETDNERLSLERQHAIKALDKCVTAKEELENDLYSKFVLVLNSKKERIRSLEEQLHSLEEQLQSQGSLDVASSSAVASTSGESSSRAKTARNNAAVAGRRVIDSASEDYNADSDEDLISPPKKQQKAISDLKESKEESPLKFSEDEEDTESKLEPVARRPQRQKASKKQTPSKPTLPRVSSGNTVEKPGSAGRKASLRKSGSGTSNKSSDNLDPDDLLDNF